MSCICLQAYIPVLYTNFCFATFLASVSVCIACENTSTFTKLIISTYNSTKGQEYPYLMKQLPEQIPSTGWICSLDPKLSNKRRQLVRFMQLVVQCRGRISITDRDSCWPQGRLGRQQSENVPAVAGGRTSVLLLMHGLNEFDLLLCLHKEQFWGYVTYRKTFHTNFLLCAMCGQCTNLQVPTPYTCCVLLNDKIIWIFLHRRYSFKVAFTSGLFCVL